MQKKIIPGLTQGNVCGLQPHSAPCELRFINHQNRPQFWTKQFIFPDKESDIHLWFGTKKKPHKTTRSSSTTHFGRVGVTEYIQLL